VRFSLICLLTVLVLGPVAAQAETVANRLERCHAQIGAARDGVAEAANTQARFRQIFIVTEHIKNCSAFVTYCVYDANPEACMTMAQAWYTDRVAVTLTRWPDRADDVLPPSMERNSYADWVARGGRHAKNVSDSLCPAEMRAFWGDLAENACATVSKGLDYFTAMSLAHWLDDQGVP